MTFKQIISELKKLGDKDKIVLKEKKFGIIANNSLGIYHNDLKELAKQIDKDNQLAIQLFDSGIYEARILCSKLYNISDLTENLMEKWVTTFENWEICDTFCMGLFAKSKFAISKAIEWTDRENEFEKRAGFTIIAAYCMADKKANNEIFEQFLPIINRHSTDDRIYVKKAVNWALRNIGKRNKDLNKKAIKIANDLIKLDNKTATWIAKDTLKELQGKKVNILDYPREIYRAEQKQKRANP
ncbi:MAG: DNA alkylation repair protein [Saprospiraceae bacterium]|nr:DNA alkylation repair protein [Saprospiraceae bacterium]